MILYYRIYVYLKVEQDIDLDQLHVWYFLESQIAYEKLPECPAEDEQNPLRHQSHFLSQVELMENLFDCLCSLMLEVTNRERFLKGEGLQLMNLMLRYY